MTLPESLSTIGYEAFRGCTELTALELGSGLKTIGDGAFAGCSNLAGTVTIPAGVTKIEDLAALEQPPQKPGATPAGASYDLSIEEQLMFK